MYILFALVWNMSYARIVQNKFSLVYFQAGGRKLFGIALVTAKKNVTEKI